MSDTSIFVFGLCTFFLLLSAIVFTLYELPRATKSMSAKDERLNGTTTSGAP